jgi:hypothetical protein
MLFVCICRWCQGSRAGVDRVEGIKQSIVQRDDGGDKDGVAKSCCSPAGVALVTLHVLGLYPQLLLCTCTSRGNWICPRDIVVLRSGGVIAIMPPW